MGVGGGESIHIPQVTGARVGGGGWADQRQEGGGPGVGEKLDDGAA